MLLEYVSLASVLGTSTIAELFPTAQTCENFAQLAKRGYYNGVIFHRIIAVRPPIK